MQLNLTRTFTSNTEKKHSAINARLLCVDSGSEHAANSLIGEPSLHKHVDFSIFILW